MFSKNQLVFFFKKNTFTINLIKLDKEPRVIKSDETVWNKNTLTQTLTQIKSQLKTKKVRLLLDDDLSYIVNLKIPFNTKSKDERQLVLDNLKTTVPDILGSKDWDYQETGKKDQTEKEIIAFIPFKDQFKAIPQALAQAGLEIEVVKPEIITKLRHENPIIGIALEKSLKGQDKKEPEINKPPKQSSELIKNNKLSGLEDNSLTQKNKHSIISKNFLIIFFTTLILGALIAGGILTSRNALNKTSKPSPSPLVVASPIPSFQASPSAMPEPELVLTDYKLLVLNGTGGKGVAGAVKDILEAKGFKNIKADNADKLDFTKTEIQLKKSSPVQLFETIDKALNSDYEVTKSAELLTEDNDYDVIITVGDLIKSEE